MAESRTPPELIGEAPVFLDALAHNSAAAPFDRPLLICGERGSGKELIAGRAHFLSSRWDGPFVKLNCAALAEELLDSELFGHEAGAFTGAQRRRKGRFERAESGTLFLDEIASASLRIQEKLLRVIEYGEFERVGGEETLVADVRVIAAANANLPAMAAEGKFRADLLDRLSFDVITAPPLRARKGDIALLAAHFAARFAREAGAGFEGFTPEALAELNAYDWPGNVRELKNVAERSFYRWIARGGAGPVGEVIIDPFEDSAKDESAVAANAVVIQEKSKEAPGRIDLRKTLNDAEKKLAREALRQAGGNQKEAAELLSLSYDQMRGLVRKHELVRA
ncbi:MAG: phage shock protein operon transcriptional activator [Parvularculaceae bacterium]